jgi:hypothetical protein
MNNYKNILKNVDVSPLMKEVNINIDRFVKIQKDVRPGQAGFEHRELDFAILRMTTIPPDVMTNKESYKKGSDELIAHDCPLYDEFPATRDFVYSLFAALKCGTIGRVAIIIIPPGCNVYGHFDTGLSADFYTRYHLMICGEPNNWAHVGLGEDQEHLEMLTGECWTFNHKKWHSFSNLSESPRIYLNIDMA